MQMGPLFGVIQLMALGTLVIAGALLAVLLQRVAIGPASLGEAISAMISVKQLPWFPALLWGIEAVLYGSIAWGLSRHALMALSGAVLGLVTRVLISVLAAMLMSTSDGEPMTSAFAQLHGELWAYRVLAIIFASGACLWPFRPALQMGYGLFVRETGGKVLEKPKQFSFSARATGAGSYQIRPASSTAAPVQHQAPSEDFSPVVPADNVFGVVTIPASVVIDSVPEAAGLLDAETSVRIRLAYIVPQLKRATVWLTWHQVFGEGDEEARRLDASGTAAGLRDVWVRIPARYYVLQMPREHFAVGNRVPPRWMSLARVPQEDEVSMTSVTE